MKHRQVPSVEEARKLAQAHLSRDDKRYENDSVLLDDVDEYDVGWVFYYQSRKFVETGDWDFAYGGNGPLLVDRQNGCVAVFGTVFPPEYYLINYRSTGDPDRARGNRIELLPGDDFDRAKAVMVLVEQLSLPDWEAEKLLDRALSEQAPIVVPSAGGATLLAAYLSTRAGVNCRKLDVP